MGKNQNFKKNRQDFLLTFFSDQDDQYTEKEVNGFWLIKQWNGSAKKWQVAIFPKDSYKRYNQAKLEYGENKRDFENAVSKEN